ncbi:snoRNA-binding rRNA-processing protein utp10 [Teratosphaeriaceae sp. CCFEE 6253]|nr:snoRNA-binding rRNA-processing protein utp10 [Teratosphaeriaceae sp. CCFEE 6253]
MATALQQQLAAIAASSTHQLDLKAQKARHSTSLLFAPRDAAAQGFETIYQLCYEGFEELCMLDARFSPFARSLFSEQSQSEDRTQMTAAENAELDRTVESFLALLSGRLLLKPATKALEWLVRRFRVQEHNTETLVLTCLPYHTSHIFPTLLSILPDQLPPTLRFLHPYVAALQCPPRHAVLAAAVNNPGFFSAFSQYVLRAARARHHSAVLVGFWASITAQAVNGMVDATRSGREAIRQQREEDLLSALGVKGVPELFLAACMIMTILATKASVADGALDAMMEAVVAAWTAQTVEDGLTCLAIMAEEKDHVSLPRSVARAVLEANDFAGMLQGLSQRYRVDKLVLGISMSGIDMVDSQSMTALTRQSAQRRHVGVSQVLAQPAIGFMADDVEMINAPDGSESRSAGDESELPADRASAVELPALDDAIESFLDSTNDDMFKVCLTIFERACASEPSFRKVIGTRRDKWASTVTYLSLLARVWTSSQEPLARVRALEAAFEELQSNTGSGLLNLQALLPYLIAGMSDGSQEARRSAANILTLMGTQRGAKLGNSGKDVEASSLDTLYGPRTSQPHLLAVQDAHKFVDSALLPILEDCVLDASYISRALSANLDGSESIDNSQAKPMRSALRINICTWLASHTIATPVLRVKSDLLGILSGVGKVANDARKKVLSSFVNKWASATSHAVQSACAFEGLAKRDLDRAVIGSLSHRSSEEICTLQEIATDDSSTMEVRPVALGRLRTLFASMKAASQASLADWLLGLAIGNSVSQSDALDALRNLQYPTEVLVHLVESLPSASDLQDEPSPSKKRRTSKDVVVLRHSDPERLDAAVRRVTLVLEIAEGAKLEKHPQLLKGLFHLLGELHQYKTLLGSQLLYLQGLLMDCLLAVVNGLKKAPTTADVDRTVIRADLIVETVRTTSSKQVHNTALLLISGLASWAPELVLHSVMPLFTFMSTTLLRQSDEYSAHVTDLTVSRIVPPLAASLKKRGKDLVSGTSELLLSSTAAFEHIPLHRRSDLFQHLVQTLGADESLFAVLAMLTERYPLDSRVPLFVSELAGHFHVATQLRALKQYLDLVFDALKPKRTLSNLILGFGEKSADQIEESVKIMLQALALLMENSALRKRVGKELAKCDDQAKGLQSTYARMLELTMQLTRDLASNGELWPAASSVLTALLRLTPTKDFIESSAQLMQIGSDETREQVFRSLEARVTQAKRGDASLQKTFLEVLPNCCVFVVKQQAVAVRHAAITCMDQIVEKYGKRDRAAVVRAAEAVAGDAALGSEDSSLRTISVLCLASMVEVLGDEFIPILPRVLTQALDYLHEEQSGQKRDEQLQDAAFGFTTAVLDYLPWMFSAEYLDRTLREAARAQNMGSDKSTPFCALAGRKIEAHALFSSLDRTFATLVGGGQQAAVRQHLRLLSLAVRHNSKRDLKQHAAVIFSILLKAFDLRRTEADKDNDSPEDWLVTFAQVDQVTLELVLKLDDQTFRPFFIRLVDWAASGLPRKEVAGRVLRLTSLYSFAQRLSEQLQSIVTSYASYLLASAADLLSTLALKNGESRLLLNAVLQTLSSSFSHDQDDFWQMPDHFNAIATPLLAQLEKARSVQVTEHITPTITQLAAAAASPEHHKAMNNTIMGYMRHESADVRLAAVHCERGITERLGLDWLALLPEMLPFISELQEDDDEDVERETLRWVRQIEDVTGESLEGMLQ